MTRMIEPPNSVLLLVGREEFSPPATFGGDASVASHDCVAVAVMSVDDGPTTVELLPEVEPRGLVRLGDFVIETEGQVSVRDVYNREYESLGIEPGSCLVTVWGNDDTEPNGVTFEVAQQGFVRRRLLLGRVAVQRCRFPVAAPVGQRRAGRLPELGPRRRSTPR